METMTETEQLLDGCIETLQGIIAGMQLERRSQLNPIVDTVESLTELSLQGKASSAVAVRHWQLLGEFFAVLGCGGSRQEPYLGDIFAATRSAGQAERCGMLGELIRKRFPPTKHAFFELPVFRPKRGRTC
jgi:hypothetical protein